MKITREQKIGARISLMVFVFGLICIMIVVTVMTNGILYLLFFPADYSWAVLLLSILFWGARAGVQIIRDKKNEDWIGVKTALLILFSFIIARIPIDVDLHKAFRDWWSFKNFIGGMLSVFFPLLLPALVYGMIIGRRIKRYIP